LAAWLPDDVAPCSGRNVWGQDRTSVARRLWTSEVGRSHPLSWDSECVTPQACGPCHGNEVMTHPIDPPQLVRTSQQKHPVRRSVLTVLALASLVAVVVDPKACAAVAGVIFVTGVVLGLFVVRGVWRTVRRPVGSLTVGDAVLGGLALRWWRRRRDHRHGNGQRLSGEWSYVPPSDPQHRG
jgi:hypothetical protein